MFTLNFFKSFLLIASVFFVASCTKDKIEDTEPLEAVTTTLLTAADNTGEFVLFSFDKNGTIALSELQSNKWDFGLKLTTFIVNSGFSGPGNAGVIVLNEVFDNVKLAPATGYKSDVSAADLAIKDGEWYDYNPVTRSFAPKAGLVFVFKTADNKYAKMELLQAEPTDNNGNTVTPPSRPTKIKYTMRYVYQANGSVNF